MVNKILSGKTSLGMELGSTRVKAVLIDDDHRVIAGGAVSWENRFAGGIWTYDLSLAVEKVRDCFAALKADVVEKYGVTLTKIGQICISGMMHGFLALDKDGNLLTPFRTWRNTMTAAEATDLSEMFGYTIPQRWSVAHLYQYMKTEPESAKNIARMTTLAGYIHLLLTGENILGCCEAAGMFPVYDTSDVPDTKPVYFPHMVEKMNALAKEHGMPWDVVSILPAIARAGAQAGTLTAAGAALLDPSGDLLPGIPFCPPEGDGGTGMVCTGGLQPGYATVSAGKSTFGLFVLDKPLSHADPEVETTVTPCGTPVAEIQSNNGTSELDSWVKIIASAMDAIGATYDKERIYSTLLLSAMDGEHDCGGVLAYNYLSGEHLTGFETGRPLLVRKSDSHLTLSNFMRAELFAIFAPLAYGYRLLRNEGVSVRTVRAHGGLFRTKGAAQKVLAAALRAPVSVSEEAGEGGAFGAALLAAYAKNKSARETLPAYLETRVFAKNKSITETPDDVLCADFDAYLDAYVRGLPIERAATECM